MASVVKEIVFDCADASAVARFWGDALGWTPNKEGEFWWMSETGVPGPELALVFQSVPEPKSTKNRVHIDVCPSGLDQADEVERLIGLGASRADVGQGDDSGFIVMSDIEGNEFCVLSRRVD